MIKRVKDLNKYLGPDWDWLRYELSEIAEAKRKYAGLEKAGYEVRFFKGTLAIIVLYKPTAEVKANAELKAKSIGR